MCYTMFKLSENNKIAVLSIYRLWFDVVMMIIPTIVDFVESVLESKANYSKVFMLPIFYSS